MPPVRRERFEFGLDPRLELASVVELLSADPKAGVPRYATDFRRLPIKYVTEAERWFAKFRGHPAVRLHAQPRIKGFDFGQRGQGLLRLSPLPEFKPATELSIDFLTQWTGDRATLDRWVDTLRDFARESRFLEFFEKKSRLLDPEVTRFKKTIESADYIGKLERYTGLPFEGRYIFYLTPFIGSHAGANVVSRLENGAAHIESVIGPSDDVARATGTYYHEELPPRIFHEAAHGVLDVVTELYGEDIEAKRPVQKEVTKEYRNWMHHVREHMVRTVMIRLVELELGEARAEHVLHHEEDMGLRFLRPMLKRLRDYEKARARYRTLADFYPRLIDVLPKPAPGEAAPARKPGEDGYPEQDWATATANPFYTQGERTRALWYLDLMLARSKNAGLLLKRAAINFLLGKREAALKDADAVLAARPGDSGALRLRGMASAPAAGGRS
ncbi:MAG: DUF4932 domain-containing protein [Elusimicrobia bacterium]|nr:DUF4932 domain-containing protein [Elusimicrobiota bacterium]